MTKAVKRTNLALAPKIHARGFYVELTWERFIDAKTVEQKYTVGPFPEFEKNLLTDFINLLAEMCLRDGGAKLYHEIPEYEKWFSGKPYETPLGLVIKTPHDDLDKDFEYELTGYYVQYHDGISSNPYYVEMTNPDGEQETDGTSPFLISLPQYHFERSMFVTMFSFTLGTELCDKIQDLCITETKTKNFRLMYDDSEYYILHMPSGTIINWYKHIGRTNTCNKPGFGLDDLREMLLLLKKELSENK